MTATPQTLVEIRDAIATGETKSTEICSEYLERIAAVDGSLHAFNNVTREQALERAAAIDRSRTEGDPRPLLGVPIAIKDNLCTRGVPTTASSRILKHFVPPYDATVVSRLEAAGAIVLGKTNCDEFGMGSSNENSAFGSVKNPWDLTAAQVGQAAGRPPPCLQG